MGAYKQNQFKLCSHPSGLIIKRHSYILAKCTIFGISSGYLTVNNSSPPFVSSVFFHPVIRAVLVFQCAHCAGVMGFVVHHNSASSFKGAWLKGGSNSCHTAPSSACAVSAQTSEPRPQHRPNRNCYSVVLQTYLIYKDATSWVQILHFQ